MSLDHLIFLSIITVPLVIILWYDRKNVKTYLGIGLLGLGLDVIWDPLAMHFDLWYYSSFPQVFGISVYTLLLYIHYLTFWYFFGNMAAKAVTKWK
ncbi:hypothetical protein KA005_67225 [bacterium]|nr:hypothetical protein [bacterium]